MNIDFKKKKPCGSDQKNMNQYEKEVSSNLFNEKNVNEFFYNGVMQKNQENSSNEESSQPFRIFNKINDLSSSERIVTNTDRFVYVDFF